MTFLAGEMVETARAEPNEDDLARQEADQQYWWAGLEWWIRCDKCGRVTDYRKPDPIQSTEDRVAFEAAWIAWEAHNGGEHTCKGGGCDWNVWRDAHRDEPGAFDDVLIEAGEPEPACEHQRMPELLALARKLAAGKRVTASECPVNPNPQAGAKLYAALTKAGGWLRTSRVRGIEPTDVLPGELALLLDGTPLEARTTRYHFRTYLDYCEAFGLPRDGGAITTELRLAVAGDLSTAPVLAQGTLF